MLLVLVVKQNIFNQIYCQYTKQCAQDDLRLYRHLLEVSRSSIQLCAIYYYKAKASLTF